METAETTSDQQLPPLKSFLQLKKKYDAPSLDDLPKSYKSNDDKEKLYVWAARNFERQVRRLHPSFTPLSNPSCFCRIVLGNCQTANSAINNPPRGNMMFCDT